MVSTSTPFGLRAVGFTGGRPETLATVLYPIQSAYATSIYLGDPVGLSAGYIIKNVYNWTASASIGQFAGVKYTNPTTKQPTWSNYWPASTTASDALAFVYVDPFQIYEVQGNAATTAASLNLNVSWANTLTTGNTTSGLSTGQVDSGNAATTNSLQYRIVGLSDIPNNAWTDTYPIIRVIHNFGFHGYLAATGV